MNRELIKVERLSFTAKSDESLIKKGKDVEILKDISFAVNKGEVIGICGESGGGKSTLAKLIAGVLQPTSGKIVFNGERKQNGISKIQILFQNSSDLLNPYRKVGDIITEALKLSGKSANDLGQSKKEIFQTVGLNFDLESRRGYELSGGERQRVALARLLAVNPVVLILDEPFSAQDVTSQLNLLNLLKKINKEYGITLICITHDLKILRKFADRILVIENGKIAETGTTEDVFNNPKHPYTKFLLEAEEYSLTSEEIHSFKKNNSFQ
ncbi:oligopeptide transport ATP-binding protein OppF [bacterium BMS3Abin03]|nr:oligopeptide transport ATP-binding protein OppF [bacterium BMS3Abin03]